MSLGIGDYKVGGAGQCSSMRRRYPWQPCERPPPGTVTLNNSVEYLLTNTYLALTSRGREGWEKQKHKMARKQQAIATTLCEELNQATAYISHKVPLLEASGHHQNSWKNCCPKSDKHLFSSNNINTQSREKLVRIDNALIFYQILSIYSLCKCTETSLENLYVDIGAN